MTSRRGRVPSTLRAFMTKEFQHIVRDRQTLTILLLMPLVQVLLFGYALRTDVRAIRLVLVDPTPDALTAQVRAAFEGSGRFHVVAAGPTTGVIEPLFRRDAADLAVVLPADFTTRLADGAPAGLLIVSDASDPNTGSLMQSYARDALARFSRRLTERSGVPAVRIEVAARLRFNPTLESVNLFVPGLIALVLTLVSALMTAVSLSREKERGTMEILLVSPLRPAQIIIGKVLPYLGLGFANAATALAAAALVFHVPLRGSLLLLLAESLLYTVVSLALGVLIAARTTSQRVAMLTAMLGTLLPNVLLSGMIFPIASMPAPLQALSRFVPARWFLIIARGIMLKGVGLGYLWRETLVLGIMTLTLLVAAVRSFRPRLG